MKIVVLVGGLSPERDVSIASGTLISNALIEKGHDVQLLDLYLGIHNKTFSPVYVNNKSDYRFSYSVPEHEPDLESIKNSVNNKSSLIGEGVLEICKKADIVFLALHGSIGENGQLQAVLDVYGIRYTGTNYIGSLLAMDKDLSKKIIRANNILTPDWKYICLNKEYTLDDIKYPCVVKPCSCGSSVGVTIVENSNQLNSAIELTKKYEDFILIEDKVEGREFSVGILNNIALPVIEIKPLSGFYDYKNKYQVGLTQEICPANISEDISNLLKEKALAVHNALRLGFYSRIDFIVDKHNNAFCLEANTLPGMTPTSLLPQEAKAIGISYHDLCERIVLER
ncbi:D-alanine--D-alanine ligase family protein [Anaerocolumna sp.]|uniref:D-alanine--D-alanine ligase family protein n=1 Tax=Anaerocolumna sp. TaxID=2041569 RepID=UPI0028ADA178|nr:D-alanine--D-alanine ligase [Anaerocolumna sp.]